MSDSASAPEWRQITATTTRTALAEAVFEHFDANAVSVLDAGDEPTVEKTLHTHPAFDLSRVVGMFAADVDVDTVTAALKDALGSATIIAVNELTQQDWARAWIAHHPPLHFGGRLWVAPHDTPVDADDAALIIRLNPGLAFGTGTHPTTALCMSWLAHADLAGRDVLDYGCGSGILAIAAAQLGARVSAVDIDPQATRATRDNAAANGVAAHIETPAMDALGDTTYDIVLANILAQPLIELAPTLHAHARPGASLVLSGLLSRQIESVRAAYRAHFTFASPVQQDDWIRLDGAHAT